MSKKLLVTLTVIVMGLFMASIAACARLLMAIRDDTPGEALAILRHFLRYGYLEATRRRRS